MQTTLTSFLRYAGWDGVFLALAGVGAVLIGLFDFTGLVDLQQPTLVRIALVAIGMLLSAVAAQNSRRAADLTELRDAIATVEVRALEMKHEFPKELAYRATRAQHFVLDTSLNADVPRFSGASPQHEYKAVLATRVRAGLAFRKVVCFFHKEHLEGVIKSIVAFSNTDYYVRHFDPPPKGIPIIHVMSFDDEHFYLG